MQHHQEKRDKSQELIINTALSLFAEHGFDKTSIRMIAKEAGISLGLLYNYFQNKDALLVAIFKKSQLDIRKSFATPTEEAATPPLTKLEQHIRQSFKLIKENKQFWKLLHGIRMQSPIAKKLMQEMKSETEFIEQQITQNLLALGIPFPNLEAKLLFATIDGIAQHYLLLENYPIDDVAEILIRKYQKK